MRVKLDVEIPKGTVGKPIAYKQFMDVETGEIQEVPMMFHDLKEGSTNKDFEMIFYGHLMEVINDLGNKKVQVLSYIVSKRDKSSNTLIKTVREIAKDLGFSSKTVNDTLLYLQDKGFIKRKTGAIFLDSNLVCDGRFKGRIMHVYRSVEEETMEQRKARLEREYKRKEVELERIKVLKDSINIQPENQLSLI